MEGQGPQSGWSGAVTKADGGAWQTALGRLLPAATRVGTTDQPNGSAVAQTAFGAMKANEGISLYKGHHRNPVCSTEILPRCTAPLSHAGPPGTVVVGEDGSQAQGPWARPRPS